MPYFKNPQTGNVGEVPHDKADEAVADGMIPVTYMHNPETKGTGWVETSRAREALDDGMEIAPTPQQDVEVPEMSKGMAAIRGAAQGASFGFGDEAQAALRTPFNMSDKESVTDTYKRLRDEQRAQNELAQKQHPWTYGASEVAAQTVPMIAAPALGVGKMGVGIGAKEAAGALTKASLNPTTVAQALELGAFKKAGIPIADIIKDAPSLFPDLMKRVASRTNIQKAVEAAKFGAASGALNEAGTQEELNAADIAKAGLEGGALGGSLGYGANAIAKGIAAGGEAVGNVGKAIGQIPRGVSNLVTRALHTSDLPPAAANALGVAADVGLTGGIGTMTRVGAYGIEKLGNVASKVPQIANQAIENATNVNISPNIAAPVAHQFQNLVDYLSPKEKQKKAEDDFQNGTNNTYSKDGQ